MGRPLHVRVAEALGWHHIDTVLGRGLWRGISPGVEFVEDENGDLPYEPMSRYRYDTDWSATGPLIERFWIDLEAFPHDGCEERWTARGSAELALHSADGKTPLEAVCNLILALKEAGKLTQ